MLRIAHEVRIFPLLTLDRQTSPYLKPLLKMLHDDGYVTDVITVPYEFQKGGNQMLTVVSNQ
jgi:hypothetical protein